MRVMMLCAAAALAGCAASEPMSPEMYQAVQRALDTTRQPSTYQIVQPQAMPAPQARSIAPLSCRTYRNIGGQIQTDCN